MNRWLTAITAALLSIATVSCQPFSVAVTVIPEHSTYIIPPYQKSQTPTQPAGTLNATTDAAASASPYLETSATAAPGPCSNNLSYMGDLTYPDHSIAHRSERIIKKWKVRNSGTCDWNAQYTFRFDSGLNFADQDSFLLFPARAGQEAVIAVPFLAPALAGEYFSYWQAVSPAGEAFGDKLYIDIVVPVE